MPIRTDTILGLLGGLVTGAGAGFGAAKVMNPAAGTAEGARWPEHWPDEKEFLSPDLKSPTKFVAVEADRVLGKGGVPLGRTVPKWVPISTEKDFFLTQELRRRWVRFFTKPIYIPEIRRFQHMLLQGPVGKGKSTAWLYPFLCYDAVNRCSNVVIDVKRPELFNAFYAPYRAHGKRVYFFDPWTEADTLGFEPLYRASSAQLDMLAQLICSYSAQGASEGGGNMQFFNAQAEKLLRGLFDLAQMWPKRFCNLPSVQQLVASGGKRILQAFNAAKQEQLDVDTLLRHIEVLCAATDAEVLGVLEPNRRGDGRTTAVADALKVLDRSGYVIQDATRLARRGWQTASPEQRKQKLTLLRSLAEQVWKERNEGLERALTNLGDFFESPAETRNRTIATLANRVAPWAQPQMAAAFSRDEIDVDDLARHERVLILGMPLGQKDTGAGVVGSLMVNTVVKMLEARPGRIQAGETDLKMHPVHQDIDEAPQVSMPNLANYLATLRRFKVGFVLIMQDRSQLKKRLGDEVNAVEACSLTQATFTDMHPETAQFMADTVLGKVTIVRKQKKKVEGKTQTDEQREQVNLLTAPELRQGRLNGEARPDIAFMTGRPVPFPFQPISWWDDPFCRQLLRAKRKLDKSAGPKKFWKWKYRWEPSQRTEPYVQRRKKQRTDKADPYWMTAEFLCEYKPEMTEPLAPPVLHLPDIGCTPVDTAELLARDGGQQPQAAAAAEEVKPEHVVPQYATDFKQLIEEEIAGRSVLMSPGAMPGWRMGDRLDALDEMRFLGNNDEEDDQ